MRQKIFSFEHLMEIQTLKFINMYNYNAIFGVFSFINFFGTKLVVWNFSPLIHFSRRSRSHKRTIELKPATNHFSRHFYTWQNRNHSTWCKSNLVCFLYDLQLRNRLFIFCLELLVSNYLFISEIRRGGLMSFPITFTRWNLYKFYIKMYRFAIFFNTVNKIE